jgi:hypothetical protein
VNQTKHIRSGGPPRLPDRSRLKAHTQVPADLADGERSDLLFAYGMFFARSKGGRMPGWAATCAKGACTVLIAFTSAAPLSPRAAFAAADLTPLQSYYEVEGAKFPNLTFRSGSQKVAYTPPPGWNVDGDRSRVTLVPADTPQAEGMIIVETLEKAMALDEVALRTHVNTLAKRLPREATSPECIVATLNPLKISGHDTILIALRYQLFGQTFRSQSILVAAGRDLWRFQFTAREHQFDKAYEPFRVSLYSIEGIAEG